MQRRNFVAASAAALVPLHAAEARPVRIAVIGIGTRGMSLLRPLLDLDAVQVPALCDTDDNALAAGAALLASASRPKAELYARGPEDFRRLLDRNDLDGVIIATPWQWHAPMMLAALDAGKAAAVEVPAAITIEECWAVLEKAEKTRVSATMLENWVWRREPMAIANMARAGLLGEVVHCESGYGHDVRAASKFDLRHGHKGNLRWRGEHSVTRNGNLYPTHQFAPVAMLMDINHGARIESLVAMGSTSRGINRYAADMWGPEHPNAKRRYANADRTTVLIQLEDGRTAINFHDTQSWHPRDDGHKYQGSKGMVRWPFPGEGTVWFQDRHWDRKSPHASQWHSLNPFLEEFDHPVWKQYGPRALSFGHNGADWLELRAWVESVRHKTDPPVPLVDALTWSAIGPLSEQSVSGKAKRMEMPDFTRGKWKTNAKYEPRWEWA